jgi:hypothetical protein
MGEDADGRFLGVSLKRSLDALAVIEGHAAVHGEEAALPRQTFSG